MSKAKDKKKDKPILGPAPHGEEFLITVAYNHSPNHLIRRGEIMADMGFPLPEPPPTNEEMQDVAFAAKMAMIKVLRARKRKAKSHGTRG